MRHPDRIDVGSFAHSFAKLGLVPGDGGAWLLSRVVGHSRAAMMTLAGDMIDAATALEYGLVGELAEADDLRVSKIADTPSFQSFRGVLSSLS